MQTGDPHLIEAIRGEIGDAPGRRITFRRFMEMALYHPEHGYYASGRARIGKDGDYITSVSVGPLFGRLLARQITEFRGELAGAAPFTVVEQGAHTGEMARDILSVCSREDLRYIIVEPFPVWRERQRETLAGFRHVTWVRSIDELEPFSGLHLSNELLDAFPVARFVGRGSIWRELFVEWADARFAFCEGDPVSSPVPPRDASDGYETETNPGLTGWVESVAAKMVSGYLLAVDYGYSRDEYYGDGRGRGTLACSRRHRPVADALADVGLMDVTAHVDFGALEELAARAGFSKEWFTDQHRLLVRLASLEFGDGGFGESREGWRLKRQFTALMHPEIMGRTFKAICLRKR